MGSYKIISEVSEYLRKLLWEGFQADPEALQLIGQEEGFVLLPPQNIADEQSRLSLWLYQVTENEFLKNKPLEKGPAENERQFPPLALNLFFLLTPLFNNQITAQRVLGRAMQIFYDNARVLISSQEVPGTAEEISVVLGRRTLEELTRVWDALREPYRLSICYEVRVTRIVSQRAMNVQTIDERILDERLATNL